jgi:hypothetical protein
MNFLILREFVRKTSEGAKKAWLSRSHKVVDPSGKIVAEGNKASMLKKMRALNKDSSSGKHFLAYAPGEGKKVGDKFGSSKDSYGLKVKAVAKEIHKSVLVDNYHTIHGKDPSPAMLKRLSEKTELASVLKDGSAARKAWLTRNKNNPKPVEGLKTRITHNKKPDKVMALGMYMTNFSDKLKDKNEKRYVEARIKQMISGDKRPKGMSGQYGIPKDRVIRLEIVTNSIWKVGRSKLNV